MMGGRPRRLRFAAKRHQASRASRRAHPRCPKKLRAVREAAGDIELRNGKTVEVDKPTRKAARAPERAGVRATVRPDVRSTTHATGDGL